MESENNKLECELEKIGIIPSEKYYPKEISQRLGFSGIPSEFKKNKINYGLIINYLKDYKPGTERPYTSWEKENISNKLNVEENN